MTAENYRELIIENYGFIPKYNNINNRLDATIMVY